MIKFQRRKKEWFMNRVGQIIQWQVSSCGRLSAVATMPHKIEIKSDEHAKSLFAFHIDNKINFKEQEITRPNIRVLRVEKQNDENADQVQVYLGDEEGKPAGCATLYTRPGLGLETKFENIIAAMLVVPVDFLKHL